MVPPMRLADVRDDAGAPKPGRAGMSAHAVTAVRPMPEGPGEHLPERPSWDCRKCGQTWPCANAKADLLCEYLVSPTALLVYLASRKWEAFHDFSASGVVPTDLDGRFVGWVR